ncbi:DUF3830 family protein [Sphingomonas flavalba]|uniref:DUF3830 family protein n=1 Tax=Sphingomonas flavalba TaxID=2559804 RepID=UPI001444EE5B|nr:DUF3830 family protein [Sphingomonas flavalba]
MSTAERAIRFTEGRSGLNARCRLLDTLAPRSAAFLWDLAGTGATFPAMHAIWTGPELSCPLPAPSLPAGVDTSPVPPENATAFPAAGDVGIAWLAEGSTKGLPPGAFFDIGIFYDQGGRLLMPFGWIQVNVAATILPEDLAEARAAIQQIRRNGACDLGIERL